MFYLQCNDKVTFSVQNKILVNIWHYNTKAFFGPFNASLTKQDFKFIMSQIARWLLELSIKNAMVHTS